MIRKHVAVALVAALFAAGCSESSSSDEGESDGPTEVQVLYGRNLEQLPIFVAEEAGLFEDYGLEVILAETGGASTITPAIAGGTGEMGLSTAPDFLLAVESGLEIVAATGTSVNTGENPRIFIMAGRDSGIREPADLADTRIGVAGRGTFAEFGPAIMLERAGVDTDGIEWVEMPPFEQPDALESGAIDAAVGVPPFVTQMERAGHTRLLDLSELAESLPVAFLSARRDWAEDNEEAIESFRAALEDAIELIEEDPEFAREVGAQYTLLPPDIVEQAGFATFEAELTPDELQLWIDLLEEGDFLDEGLDAADLIVPPPAE